MNIKFQNALNLIPQNTPPIWFMRQAGRYHADYQSLKKDHSFAELCVKPELAARVALGPIRDFDFDVAILFSDLLFILEALGMDLSYETGRPVLTWDASIESVNALHDSGTAIKKLEFQRKAMRLTREQLPEDKSLIGFVGGPFTLFSYAVESSHDKRLIETKRKLELFTPFCEKLMPLLKENIQIQLDGGAEVVMLFDTSVGEASPIMFKEIFAPLLNELSNEFPKKLGYYGRGINLSYLTNLNNQFTGFGYDHRWDLIQILDGSQKGFVQGNFDEALLCVEPEKFKKHFDSYLDRLSALSPEQRKGWVCGLGHGMLPWAYEENVKYIVKSVREVFGE